MAKQWNLVLILAKLLELLLGLFKPQIAKSISNSLAKFISQILLFVNSQNNMGRKNISSPIDWQILFPKTQNPTNETKRPAKRTRSPAKHDEKDRC